VYGDHEHRNVKYDTEEGSCDIRKRWVIAVLYCIGVVFSWGYDRPDCLHGARVNDQNVLYIDREPVPDIMAHFMPGTLSSSMRLQSRFFIRSLNQTPVLPSATRTFAIFDPVPNPASRTKAPEFL
jgi:hypothetical protein